jgi:hypothetical protein
MFPWMKRTGGQTFPGQHGRRASVIRDPGSTATQDTRHNQQEQISKMQKPFIRQQRGLEIAIQQNSMQREE